jgi:PST family polysaccharide transporter
MTHLGRRTLDGAIIAIVAQAGRMAIQLAQVVIMSRLIAPEGFGLVAMATSVTGFLGIFTDLGLSTATVQRKEIDQDTVSALFYANLAMGFAVMLAACAAAPLAARLFNDSRVTWAVTGMSITIPLGAAAAQHGALLARGMRWFTIQWTGILAQVVGFVAGLLLAWRTDLGYWAIVGGAWASGLTGVMLIWVVCPWRPSRVRDWRSATSALRFGLNLTGFNVVNYFHRQFDNALIGWRWGPTELGFYSRAYALLTLPLGAVSGPVSSVVVPMLSRLQDHPERWRRAYLDALSIVTFAGTGIAAVSITTAEPMVLLLFGAGWHRTATIFQYLAISMFVSIPMNSTGWIYTSLGQSARMFRWACMAVPVIVISFLLGLPFQAPGVALSYSVCMILLSVPCLAFAAAKSPVTLGEIFWATAPFILSGVSAVVMASCTKSAMIRFPPSGRFMSVAGITAIGYILTLAVVCLFSAKTRQDSTLRLRKALSLCKRPW